jgi:hypothetical protein
MHLYLLETLLAAVKILAEKTVISYASDGLYLADIALIVMEGVFLMFMDTSILFLLIGLIGLIGLGLMIFLFRFGHV